MSYPPLVRDYVVFMCRLVFLWNHGGIMTRTVILRNVYDFLRAARRVTEGIY